MVSPFLSGALGFITSMSIESVLYLLPTLLLCVVAAIIHARKALSSKKKLNLPPGPPGLPLLGHLHLLGKQPHHSFYQLSKTYGPLIGLRFGSVPVLVASSPAMAQQILRTHDPTFANRVRSIAVREGVYGAASGITFSDSGSHWRYLRQLCAVDLFSTKRIEGFRHVRMKEIERLVGLVRAEAEAGVSTELRPKLHEATNNIVTTMFLGRPLSELVASIDKQQKSTNIVNLVIEVLEVLGHFNIGDYLPSLALLDLQGLGRRSRDAGRRMKAAFQNVINTRRQLHQGNYHSPNDFLDILLVDSQISDNDIQAIFLDMFGGGSDTSSLLIEWALTELLAHPAKMRKLEEEIKEVVGETRRVHETDIAKLPYLTAVAKETMRLHPVLPFLVPHRANQDIEIGGYDIAKETVVFVNTWAIGRDPEAWPEKTFDFYPERFLENNMDVRGVHFEFLPFGSGRRGCPGWSLGFLHFQIILASLIHSFHWTSQEEPDMSEQFGIVMTKATPLVAKATQKHYK